MKMRAPVVALMVVATTTLLAGPAGAADPTTATASAGSVNLTSGGTVTSQDSIAPCTTPGANSTSGVTPLPGVQYGSATTSCTVAADTGDVTAKAAGGRFQVSLLRDHGGPLIKLTKWSVQCATDGANSSGSMSVAGLTGVTVPSSIPVNYTVTVPGQAQGDPALAKVVFNEMVAPDPPDGSMTLNLMHITLFPDSPDGPEHGDIVLGTVGCNPSWDGETS